MPTTSKYQQHEQEIIQMYTNGHLLIDISTKFGCSRETVANILRKNNIAITNHKVLLNKEDVLLYHQTSQSLKETAKYFGVSQCYVREILIDSGNRKNLRAKNWDRSNDNKIVEMYNNGMSAEDIGEAFGFCHTSIFRHLQRLGVARRKTSNKTYIGVALSTFNRIKSSAVSRRLEFNVTKEYLEQLFEQQNKKCALSGVDIALPTNFTEQSTGVGTASLDRIDSSLGYIEGNVQWVHKKINIMKQSMNDQEFIEWCHIISQHNSY